jgi:hypothetical protein
MSFDAFVLMQEIPVSCTFTLRTQNTADQRQVRLYPNLQARIRLREYRAMVETVIVN